MKDDFIIKPRQGEAQAIKQKFNRKASVFLICLAIAAFFWVITTLSGEFQRPVKFPVKYINLPKDKVISNNLPDSLEVDLKGSGFDLLRLKLRQHLEPLEIDASTYRPHKGSDYFYITTNNKLEKMSRKIGGDFHVLSIIPDTIFLNFSKKTSKLVPVTAKLNLGFKKEFEQSDSIVIFPKEVKISGSPALVDQVKSLHTEDINLKDLDKTITVRRAIVKSPELKQLEFSTDSVGVHIAVAKFTEGVAEVPLELLNVPKNTVVKVFPDKIKLTYLVPFDSFEKIKPEMFRLVVDYNHLENGSSKTHMELVKSPKMVHSINLTPDRVEFIIRK